MSLSNPGRSTLFLALADLPLERLRDHSPCTVGLDVEAVVRSDATYRGSAFDRIVRLKLSPLFQSISIITFRNKLFTHTHDKMMMFMSLK